jgi:TetR/AcrR family transcriptional regulator, transcriptional repressor of bet genes
VPSASTASSLSSAGTQPAVCGPVTQLEWKVWLAFWGRAAAVERLRQEQQRRYAEWRGLLGKLIRRARPHDTAADRRTAVDLIAGAIDGLGIQATLEPAKFTDARLRRAASVIARSAL